jgi:hypothetical protein
MYIDQQVRQQVTELQQKFIEATSIMFMRGDSRVEIPAWRRLLSRTLTAIGLVTLPFTLELSTMRFSMKATLFSLGLAAFFILVFIVLNHGNLLTWTLALIGSPGLIAGANVDLHTWVFLAFFLIQLGLLLSPMTRYERAALHLLLLWEGLLSAVAFVMTWQVFFVFTFLLAVVSGFRVYGMTKTLRGLAVTTILVTLYVLFADVAVGQILLLLLAPVIFFRVFRVTS